MHTGRSSVISAVISANSENCGQVFDSWCVVYVLSSGYTPQCLPAFLEQLWQLDSMINCSGVGTSALWKLRVPDS
jgi:hypothetical protein